MRSLEMSRNVKGVWSCGGVCRSEAAEKIRVRWGSYSEMNRFLS